MSRVVLYKLDELKLFKKYKEVEFNLMLSCGFKVRKSFTSWRHEFQNLGVTHGTVLNPRQK